MLVDRGLHATASLVVDDEDTALRLRSGDVDVLASARLVALCEEASCRAVSDVLEPGRTSVSVRVQLDHVAPVKVGTEVVAEATLEKVEGRRLVFTVAVTDAAGLVAAGRLTRTVVGVESFLAKAR